MLLPVTTLYEKEQYKNIQLTLFEKIPTGKYLFIFYVNDNKDYTVSAHLLYGL